MLSHLARSRGQSFWQVKQNLISLLAKGCALQALSSLRFLACCSVFLSFISNIYQNLNCRHPSANFLQHGLTSLLVGTSTIFRWESKIEIFSTGRFSIALRSFEPILTFEMKFVILPHFGFYVKSSQPCPRYDCLSQVFRSASVRVSAMSTMSTASSLSKTGFHLNIYGSSCPKRHLDRSRH